MGHQGEDNSLANAWITLRIMLTVKLATPRDMEQGQGERVRCSALGRRGTIPNITVPGLM